MRSRLARFSYIYIAYRKFCQRQVETRDCGTKAASLAAAAAAAVASLGVISSAMFILEMKERAREKYRRLI